MLRTTRRRGPASICATIALLSLASPASAAKPTRTEPEELRYFYAGAQHAAPGTTTMKSAGGAVTHHKPQVSQSEGDIHSHASIAMMDFDPDRTRDMVEAGWMIHPGEESPHLYVAYYVNGSGYPQNGHVNYENPPFVSFAAPKPGDSLKSDGTASEFAFAHLQSTPTNSGTGPGWYLRYDGRWIGYFPDKLWETTTPKRGKTPASTTPSDFTSARAVMWFGEVLSSRVNPCADMGNGLPGTDLGAASFSGLTADGAPVLLGPLDYFDTPALYSAEPFATTDAGGFRFGGPGGC